MPRQSFDTLDVLRLEIEQEPTGLVNLIQNPSGELGGYGWLTPLAGSVLRGVVSAYTDYRLGLEYTTATTATNNYFSSEPLPASAGQYVAARWHVNYTPYGYYRARFVWLDGTGATLSTSAWSSFSTDYTDHAIPPTVAPASTAFVRISFEVGRPGGVYGHTYGGQKFSVRDVVVATAATKAGLGATRTNQCTNPSFETNATGWTTSGTVPPTIAQSAARATSGTKCGLITWGAGTGAVSAPVVAGSIGAGNKYTSSLRVWVPTGSPDVRIVGSLTPSADTGGLRDQWVTLTVTATSASGSPQLQVQPVTTPAAGQTVYVDGALIEKGEATGSYFDGSTPDVASTFYDWSGTAHASASTAYTLALDDLEPVPYLNILDTVNEIELIREDLNVGTITARICNEDLDPSVADTIRPGRRVRLTALRDDTGLWEPLLTGKVPDASAAYDLLRKARRPSDTKWVEVTLTVTDPVQVLASAARPEGVARISDLAHVLEGCGVPWVVNGDSNQVVGAVVSRNDNATAIDQLAITRDSELGYAWVDRYGVVQAWSALPDPFAELIVNGGFESVIAAPDWYVQADAGTPTAVRDAAQAYAGTYSAKLTNTNAAATVMQLLTYNPTAAATWGALRIVPGAVYRLSLQSLAATTARTVFALVRWYDGVGTDATLLTTSGGDFESSAVIDNTTTDWTELAIDLTAPPGAVACDLVFGIALAAGSIPAGEVHYFDAVTMKAIETPYDLDETVYSNLDVAFATGDCINEVQVTYLRYNATTKQTEEVAYGPYLDQSSIDEWGRYSKPFTIQAATEDPDAIEAYAQEILDRNAIPVDRVTGARLAIRDLDDLVAGRAFLDLYDLVHITNAEKAIDEYARVTKIRHSITPKKWLVELGFSGTESVAAPQITPSPGAGLAGTTTKPQAGTVSVPVGASTAEASVAVVFPIPFPSTPRVVTQQRQGSALFYAARPGLITPAGFTCNAIKASTTGASNVAVDWIAVVDQ